MGDQYYVAPLNLNTRVDENDQVDTLNVDNSNNPANSEGTLTSSRITGLGMGGDTVVAGQAFAGGITYSNLETVNIDLGGGNNHLTVESTGDGSTSSRPAAATTRSTSRRSAATRASAPAAATTPSTSTRARTSSSSAAC